MTHVKTMLTGDVKRLQIADVLLAEPREKSNRLATFCRPVKEKSGILSAVMQVQNCRARGDVVIKPGDVIADIEVIDLEREGDVRVVSDFTIERAEDKIEGENKEHVAAMQQDESDAKDHFENPVGHPKKDWRHGLSGVEQCACVQSDDENFKAWADKNRKAIEEQTGAAAETDEVKLLLMKLLYIYRVVMAENPKCPRPVKGVEHKIVLKPGVDVIPKRCRLYRISPDMLEAERKETEIMLNSGVIEPSDSPWSAPVVMVKKKRNIDGTPGGWRYCCNYAATCNPVTKADSFPMCRIDETLDKLAEAGCFSAVDAASGFWGIKMEAQSKQYTAFATHSHGLCQFVRMPFGLINSGATFCRFMAIVLGNLLMTNNPDGCCLGFVDDVVCHSKVSGDQHINDLAKMLEKFETHGVSLKLAKCQWFMTKMPYLGHVVEAKKGVSVDRDKVAAVAAWRPCQTTGDLQSFLGAAVFYAKFIPQFAAIARPLRDLVKQFKSKSIDLTGRWNEQHQKSFDQIKASLCLAPVLAFPNFSKPFILLTDASYGMISCVLAQVSDEGVERPIAYASRSLTETEKRYGITDKEALAVVYGSRKFRSYIASSPVVCITDHSALKQLQTRAVFATDRQARFALEISDLDLIICHRPGRVHYLADALSRIVGEQDPEQIEKMLNDVTESHMLAAVKRAGLSTGDDGQDMELFRDLIDDPMNTVMNEKLDKALGIDQWGSSRMYSSNRQDNRLQLMIRGATLMGEEGETGANAAEVVEGITKELLTGEYERGATSLINSDDAEEEIRGLQRLESIVGSLSTATTRNEQTHIVAAEQEGITDPPNATLVR